MEYHGNGVASRCLAEQRELVLESGELRESKMYDAI